MNNHRVMVSRRMLPPNSRVEFICQGTRSTQQAERGA
jgi:hypothetical protein